MPLPFTVAMWAAAVVIIGARFVVPALPLASAAALSRGDRVVAVLGMAGLVLHCTSMFALPLLSWVPGSETVTHPINALGAASVVWYVVPAVLTVVGLRRVPWPVLAVDVAALAFVGITMYDGAPLRLHLTSILTLIVVLAATLSAFVTIGPPRSRARVRRTPRAASA